MIICSCNVLSDKDITAAIAAGARRPSAVYAHRQCRAECGQCAGNICRMLRESGVQGVTGCEAACAETSPLQSPAPAHVTEMQDQLGQLGNVAA